MPRLDFGLPSAQIPQVEKHPKPPLASPLMPTGLTGSLLTGVFSPFPAQDQVNVGAQGSAKASITIETELSYVVHTVKRGETLEQIAKKFLGDPKRSGEIFEANRDELRNPNDIQAGMKLRIPVASTTVPEEDPFPLPTNSNPPAAPQYTSHQVKRGESLSSIALRTLGDSERYMEIYQANRDQLKTPNSLRVGMTLKIPSREPAGAVQPTKPPGNGSTAPVAPVTGNTPIDATGLTPGAQELLKAMQDYQAFHAQQGNVDRTKTTPAQLREIAIELDAASKAFGVDPKMMLAVYAHESGGINPRARSHTGAGGLGQLTGVAIRQVHFMAGIGKGAQPREPYSQYKSNFVQNHRSINERYNIKANVWTSVAYMSYEINDRARLGRGVEKTLKRYGDPTVPTYANKVNAEHRTLFGSRLF